MIDNRKRAIAKAITWRITGATILGLLAYLFTGSVAIVGALVVIHNIIQTIVYIIHERIWNVISWGKTKGLLIQMTGMSGAGKTTISKLVAEKLKQKGYLVELIDGDQYRQNVTKDLGFFKEDRLENIRRLGFIGKTLARNNVIAIMATINPYKIGRQELTRCGAKTIHVKCSLKELIERDPKGLYHKALLPDGNPDKIDNFTGVSDPYEAPSDPDLVLDTEFESINSCVAKMVKFIERNV